MICLMSMEVDESPVDNNRSSHMLASTSNDVAQMKCRLNGAMSSFDLFANNSSNSSKKHESTRMKFDHFIDEGVLKRKTLIFWHGGKLMVSSILLYKEMQWIF